MANRKQLKLPFHARVRKARHRASTTGYDVKVVRRLWQLDELEFGAMLGEPLESAENTVHRWEMGLLEPNPYQRRWIYAEVLRYRHCRRWKVQCRPLPEYRPLTALGTWWGWRTT